MSVEIRFPNISGRTSAEQLGQIRSYLYQLAEQLQQTLSDLEGRTQRVYSPKGVELKEGEAEFEAVKPHIIKSAEILNAYFGSFNRRLSGRYISKGDFASYVEDTALRLEANSQGIDQLYTRMESLDSATQNMDSALTSVTAHIRSGYLCDDESGNPVYGVEIGQTTEVEGEEVFNKFARFSAGRLTFYDDEGNELAHISGQKLVIPSLEVDGKDMVSHVCESLSLSGSADGEGFTLKGYRWADGRVESRGRIDLSQRVDELADGALLSLPLTLPSEVATPAGLTAFPHSDLPLSLCYDSEEGALRIYSPLGAPSFLKVDLLVFTE